MLSRKELTNTLLNILQDRVVKSALSRLIGTTAGFKAWVLKFVLDEFYDDIAEPVMKLAIRKGLKAYDVSKGGYYNAKFYKARDKKDWDELKRIADLSRK